MTARATVTFVVTLKIPLIPGRNPERYRAEGSRRNDLSDLVGRLG